MYVSDGTARKILKEAGATRVSADATQEFQKCINRYAFEVAQKAVKFAKHAKRKTVEGSDISLAAY